MVNKERIRLLLDALRSGKYLQGTGQLRFDDNFCCLGVACDIYKENNPDRASWENHGYFRTRYDGDDDGSSMELPSEVSSWYGFHTSDPRFYVEKLPQELQAEIAKVDPPPYPLTATMLNDQVKLTFPEIADCFEAQYLRG